MLTKKTSSEIWIKKCFKTYFLFLPEASVYIISKIILVMGMHWGTSYCIYACK